MVATNTGSGTQYVVLDTNIWVHHARMLRSPLGVAAAHYIARAGMTIAVPEVVEHEVDKHLIKECRDAADRAQKQYQTLSMLTGVEYLHQLPDSVVQSFRTQFEGLDYVRWLPVTDAQLRRAYVKSINDIPPNSPGNQQFKDSCIWEAVIDMAADGEVHFITKDKAFFAKDEVGLASSLQSEADATGPVYLYQNMESFLNAIKPSVPDLDTARVSSLLAASVPTTVEDSGIMLSSVASQAFEIFATSDPHVVSLTFTLGFDATFQSPQEQSTTGRANVHGQCSYDIAHDSVSSVFLNNVDYFLEDGTPRTSIAYLRASPDAGTWPRKYVIHQRL